MLSRLGETVINQWARIDENVYKSIAANMCRNWRSFYFISPCEAKGLSGRTCTWLHHVSRSRNLGR